MIFGYIWLTAWSGAILGMFYIWWKECRKSMLAFAILNAIFFIITINNIMERQ